MDIDALLLSRLQFAANISFHILFPMITIALGWVLVGLKLAYNRTRDMAWMEAYQLWVKVFAVTFALGVVSGITMSFQFGTNWPGFMEKVGNVAGPLLAYEIMTAFFLEAVFLGVMLFGFSRVSNRVHTAATVIVAIGTTLSAFWILVLNSWMQTPQGFELRDGVVHATDWWAIVFSPSMPYRFVHVLLASGLTAAFLIAGLSAYRWLRGDRVRSVALSLKVGIGMAAIIAPLQILAGDLHGINTLEHQPQKVAAMEANWETRGNVPLVLFAIPDEAARTNRFEIAVPNGASWILTHSADGVVPGLDDFVGEHPPVLPVFFAFRDGRHGPLDAGARLVRRLSALAPGRARPLARPGLRRHDLLRLDRHPRRLVHDRDRSSALAGLGGALDRRCRGRRPARHGRVHAGRLRHALRPPARHLYRRALPARQKGRRGADRPPARARAGRPGAGGIRPWARSSPIPGRGCPWFSPA